MQGILQTMLAERGFDFLRDTQGAEIVLQRRGVTPPSCIARLAVRMVVEFEAEPDPTGLRATKITIGPEARR